MTSTFQDREAPTPDSAAGADLAIDAVEHQLSLFWRRTRAITHRISRTVHPEMEPAAYGLLTILSTEGSMRLTDLAARIGVGKPSVSRQVAFLESLGLVQKKADPLDGRSQGISLTAEGKARMAAIHAARKAAFHEKLAGWSETELNQLSALMQRLNAAYAEELSSGREG